MKDLLWIDPEDEMASGAAQFVICGWCREEAYFFGLEGQPAPETPPDFDKSIVTGVRMRAEAGFEAGAAFICHDCVVEVNRAMKSDNSEPGIVRLRYFINTHAPDDGLTDLIGACCICEQEDIMTGILSTRWPRTGKDNGIIIADTFQSLMDSERLTGPVSPERAALLSLVAGHYIVAICPACEDKIFNASEGSEPVNLQVKYVCAGPPDSPGRIPIDEVKPHGSGPVEFTHIDGESETMAKLAESSEYEEMLALFQSGQKIRDRAEELAKKMIVDEDGKGPGGVYIGAMVRVKLGHDYIGGMVGHITGFGVGIDPETHEEFDSYQIAVPMILPMVEISPTWLPHVVFASDVEVIRNEPLGDDEMKTIILGVNTMPEVEDLVKAWRQGGYADTDADDFMRGLFNVKRGL